MHNRPQCCKNLQRNKRNGDDAKRDNPLHNISLACPEGAIHASMLAGHRPDTDPLCL